MRRTIRGKASIRSVSIMRLRTDTSHPLALPFDCCWTTSMTVTGFRTLAAPTLWAMNDASSVSKALLRRMMFALELRPPTTAVRARIWARQLAQHGIEARPDEAHTLAREFAATPGMAAGATAAARISGGGIDTVRRGVRGLSRVLSSAAPPQGTPALFDPALIRADTDPVALADSLVGSRERRFSLCLQGPPGTGKSAFVRYLAERLGLEVMQKRASDLMSCWVADAQGKGM